MAMDVEVDEAGGHLVRVYGIYEVRGRRNMEFESPWDHQEGFLEK
jgi:hypothetical protein